MPTRLLVALLCLTVLALLRPSPANAADEPIRLWHSYRGEEEGALQEIVGGWDGAPVELLALPYDAASNKLSAAIPIGDGPDLYVDSHERLGDYRRRGIVGPADAVLDPHAYAPHVRDAVVHDGVVWAVPLSLKSVALFQNLALTTIEPRTLDDVVALAAELPAGVVALAYEARNPYAHAPILHAFGGTMLQADDSFGFVGPAAERSLAYAAALIEAGVVPADADGALVTNLFRSGKAAFAISGPWLAADVGDAVRFRVRPLPSIVAADAPMRPLLTIEALMLSPQGAERAEVIALARHLASAQAAEIRQGRARTPSARLDVPAPPDDPILRAFAEQAATAIPMSSSPAMRATWEPARRAMRKVLAGEADAGDALREAAHRFDDVRRPPPEPRSPAPILVLACGLLVFGALVLVRRARSEQGRALLARSWSAYAWVAHAVIAVGVLVILPLVVGAATALFAGPAGESHYVGLANFVEILTARGGPLLASGSFWLVLLVTLAWTVVNVAGHLGIGVALGILLSRPLLRMKAIYRVLLIIPWAVPNYVTALAWRGMFHRQFGAVAALTQELGDLLGTTIEPISWFSRFSTAFSANVATNVWLGFPFMMVVTLGALTAVPKDVLEAAEVDGATRWQRLRRVTLPMIRPSLMPAITLGAIWTFNMFNVVFLVSGGDPDGTTDILVSEAYRWAFTREAQYGYAAAYAVLIFVLLLGATRMLERWKTAWAGGGRGEVDA